MKNIGTILLKILKKQYPLDLVKCHLIDTLCEEYQLNDISQTFTITANEYYTNEEKQFNINLLKDDYTIIGYTTHLLWDNIIRIVIAIGKTEEIYGSYNYQLEKCFFTLDYNSEDIEPKSFFSYNVYFKHFYSLD